MSTAERLRLQPMLIQSALCCPYLLSTGGPSPFRKQSHDYIRTNVCEVGTKPPFTPPRALQPCSPLLSEASLHLFVMK